MASFIVSYHLSGTITIKADSESEAEDRIKGYFVSEADTINDNVLINGIEGYGDLKRKEGYRIESDAIFVTNIEECEEKEHV